MIIFSKYSGRIFGTHQKIDRVARGHLSGLLKKDAQFPSGKEIIHFEGVNGPDGIKRKSPSVDEPWHYINPFDKEDIGILKIIDEHYGLLCKALKDKNRTRAAFEASWLAHAVVDGLTPAHHYPYEEKLSELRGGEPHTLRTTIRKKLIMPGATRRQKIKNNWHMWGPRGLFTTHMSFEMGIASLIVPMSFKDARPSQQDIKKMRSLALDDWFRGLVRDIAGMEFYDEFIKSGWTVRLAAKIRRQLAPTLVKAVSLVWYRAALDAGIAKEVE